MEQDAVRSLFDIAPEDESYRYFMRVEPVRR